MSSVIKYRVTIRPINFKIVVSEHIGLLIAQHAFLSARNNAIE